MSAILKQKLIDIANGFTKYGLWKGGGSSALSDMTDVTFTDLQANDVLKYNGSVWINDDNLHEYSTEEKIVGKWIDGKPLYQKTVIYDITSTDDFISIPLNLESPDFIILYDFTLNNGNTFYGHAEPYRYYRIIDKSSFYLKLSIKNWIFGTTAYITIRYTKTTD